MFSSNIQLVREIILVANFFLIVHFREFLSFAFFITLLFAQFYLMRMVTMI